VYVIQDYGKEIKNSKYDLRYNGDLNACINIDHRLMRTVGYR